MATPSKQPKQPPAYNLRRSPADLDYQFYRRYDPGFLFNKARALMYIVKNPDAFATSLREFEETNNGPDGKFFESLRAELHFAEMHQFEAFLALLVAIYQPKPHWIYLTEYTTAEIKTAAEHLIAGNVDALTGGQSATVGEFVTQAVYAGLNPQDAEEVQARWDENTDNIGWLLAHMAHRYIDGREYNSYKHGLRVMTGAHSVEISLESDAEQPQPPIFTTTSEDSVSYLELEKVSREGKTSIDIHEVTKHFGPHESFRYLDAMHQLAMTIVGMRLFLLEYSKGDATRATISGCVFLDLDRTEVLGWGSSNREFRFTV